jgi:hypothetical protein
MICFDAPPEESVSMHRHFVKECGWTPQQYREIEDFAWFNADVSLWHRGEMLGEESLGACCYGNADEFWQRCAAGYFADMVCELVREHIPDLTSWAEQWRADLRDKATLREVT